MSLGMNHGTQPGANKIHGTGDCRRSEAWLFAQAVLGNPVCQSSVRPHDADPQRELLEWVRAIRPADDRVCGGTKPSREHNSPVQPDSVGETLWEQEHRRWLRDVLALREADWDPAEHPRGAFPQNRGWFSPKGGTSGSQQRTSGNDVRPSALNEPERVLARIKLSSGNEWSGERVLDIMSILAPEWLPFVNRNATLALASGGTIAPETTVRSGEFGPEIHNLPDVPLRQLGRTTIHFDIPANWNDYQVVQHMLNQFADDVDVHRLAAQWAADKPDVFDRLRQDRFKNGLATITALAQGYVTALASLAPGGQAAVATWDIQNGDNLGAALDAAFLLPISKIAKSGLETGGTIAIHAGEKLIAALPVKFVEKVGKLTPQKKALLHVRLSAAKTRFEAAQIVEDFLATEFDRHHPLALFLGGDEQQFLSEIPRSVHREFHSLLREELRAAGFPLRIGGKGGSGQDWRRYSERFSGSQGKAFDAVLRASRATDAKHGTTVTQWVWKYLIGKNATFLP